MHHLYGRITIRPLACLSRITVQTSSVADSGHDFSEIVCAARVKRGLAIAAAGLHSVILAGPPGVGKTALAERLVDILPTPNMTEQVEIQAIRSINSAASTKLATRPFRRLHHAMNMQRIGHDMVTQELMRAHRGVILFDELPEFSRSTLIALRQVVDRTNTMPALQLEEATIPLQTLWVATQNLCSCGRTGTTQDCVCTVAQIAAFRRLIDKPLLDRTDLYVTVGQERNAVISKAQLSSMQLSEMVKGARERQSERFGSESYFNSQMTISEIEQYVILSNQTRHFARTLSDHHRLSGRAYHSLLRVGRTIADLDQSERVTDAHIAEAMQYRADQL
jgi:magnesium chelatase family protein